MLRRLVRLPSPNRVPISSFIGQIASLLVLIMLLSICLPTQQLTAKAFLLARPRLLLNKVSVGASTRTHHSKGFTDSQVLLHRSAAFGTLNRFRVGPPVLASVDQRRFNSFGALFNDFRQPMQRGTFSSSAMSSTNSVNSPSPPAAVVSAGSASVPQDEDTGRLKQALMQWRKDASFRSGKPAYRIFTNKALDALCSFRPDSQEALFCVPGIGNNLVGLEDEVLSIISKHTPPSSAHKRFSMDEIRGVTKKPRAKRAKKESSLKEHEDSDVAVQQQKSAPRMSTSVPNSNAAVSDLSPEQLAAAQRALRGNNVFITGAAGTGKSHVLRYIVQELRRQYGTDSVFPVAPTGIAAINIGGTTVHSFAGIGLGTSRPERLLAAIQKKKKVLQRWEDCRVLVIDEISMLDPDLLELLDFLAKKLKNNNKPFGGIQIIAFGDFMQLPPVKSSKDGRRLCFESPAWVAAGLASKLDAVSSDTVGANTTDDQSGPTGDEVGANGDEGGTIILSTIVRQQDDADFIRILNAIRLGVPPASVLAELNKCDVKFKPLPTDGIIPTKLYCTNKDVDKENQLRLAELPGEAITFTAQDEWRIRASTAQSKKEMTESMDRMVPNSFELKVGAQVMLLRNRYDAPSSAASSSSAKPELANGSRGVVIKMLRVPAKSRLGGSEMMSETIVPVVKFDSGQVLEVYPVETLHQEPGKKGGLLARKQIPLKLAWAITVHKSQGSTLSRAELMIQNTFDFGQAYTALSRVQSLRGLWLTKPLHVWNFKTNPIVLNYYGIESQQP